MITREMLEKRKAELETAKKQIEVTFYQVIGKLTDTTELLEELDKAEKANKTEEK